MPTIKELGSKYAQSIKSAYNPTVERTEADRVVEAINDLVWSESKEPLSLADRERIIEYIQDELVEPGVAFKEADNQRYLQLVAYMLNRIRTESGGRK